MSQGFEIKSIRLCNFRNYQEEHRLFDDGINKIIGPNATGKTNLLEAIALTTMISSFRNPKTKDLICTNGNADSASVLAEIYDKDIDSEFKIELKITDNKKTYKLNGKSKKIVDLKGKFPAVVFSPDDLMVVKGGNTLRRDTIDQLGSQISAEYYTVLKDYTKALKQKNSLLKEGINKDLLLSINEVMTICGAQLMYFRLALINKIKPIVSDFYQEISDSGESLEIEYFPSWDNESLLAEILRDDARKKLETVFSDFMQEEILRKSAVVGPHRDKILFKLDGRNAQSFASQGQQRSIVLSLKLAEVKLIEKLLEKKPILLLDDVMSELDSNRQKKLLNFIKQQTQSFITSAS